MLFISGHKIILKYNVL